MPTPPASKRHRRSHRATPRRRRPSTSTDDAVPTLAGSRLPPLLRLRDPPTAREAKASSPRCSWRSLSPDVPTSGNHPNSVNSSAAKHSEDTLRGERARMPDQARVVVHILQSRGQRIRVVAVPSDDIVAGATKYRSGRLTAPRIAVLEASGIGVSSPLLAVGEGEESLEVGYRARMGCRWIGCRRALRHGRRGRAGRNRDWGRRRRIRRRRSPQLPRPWCAISDTVTSEAWACLAAFVSPSAHTKYTAASIGAGSAVDVDVEADGDAGQVGQCRQRQR